MAERHDTTTQRLTRTLERALNGTPLSEEDGHRILQARDPQHLERIFEAACRLRHRHFGPRVFFYGFLYFSTFCRNDCRFCNYRRTNQLSPRYRKSRPEILTEARRFADQVHLIDLTMGEDPAFFGEHGDGFDPLARLVQEVKAVSGLPVMISPGVVPPQVLDALKNAGADWYACYQETHNRRLFHRLRTGQSYEQRWRAKQAASQRGLLVEEGILCGVGETDADILRSLQSMARLDADQVRVMQFVPQQGTPMADIRPGGSNREQLIIALLRLTFPDRLIPASLDVEGLAGLASRLRAGANVVTSLVPPGKGFMGVSQSQKDIDAARRIPAAVEPVLRQCHLVPATARDYIEWVEQRHRRKSTPRP